MHIIVIIIAICIVIAILKLLFSSPGSAIVTIMILIAIIVVIIRNKVLKTKEINNQEEEKDEYKLNLDLLDRNQNPPQKPKRKVEAENYIQTDSVQKKLNQVSGSDNLKNSTGRNAYTKLKGNYVFFDLETTGLSPYYDEIIQISAIKVSDSHIVGNFNQYVNPNQPISAKITNLTGISNATVANSPKIGSVLFEFDRFIDNYILVAHNAANFDIKFIDEAYKRIFGKAFANNYIDTLQISRAVFPDMPNHKLKTLVQEFGLNANNTHNAMDDANCVYQLFVTQCQYIKDINIFIIKPDIPKMPIYQSPEFNESGDPLISRSDIEINPINERSTLNMIQSNIGKGYDDGLSFFHEGNDLRKSGDFQAAILLFDKARDKGYCSFFLYEAYALAYQSLKDYDNEIDILDEGIERLKSLNISTFKLEARRDKAVQRWYKKQERLKKQEGNQIKRQEIEKQRLERLEEKRKKEELKISVDGLPKKEVKRAVLQLSEDMRVIKRFDSVSEAAREIGVDPKGIRSAAKGLQKKSGGFAWKYEDDIEKIELDKEEYNN